MVMAQGFKESTSPAKVTKGKETNPPFWARVQATLVQTPVFINYNVTLNLLRSKEFEITEIEEKAMAKPANSGLS